MCCSAYNVTHKFMLHMTRKCLLFNGFLSLDIT